MFKTPFEIFLSSLEDIANFLKKKVPEGYEWQNWKDCNNTSTAINCIINKENHFQRYYLVPVKQKEA